MLGNSSVMSKDTPTCPELSEALNAERMQFKFQTSASRALSSIVLLNRFGHLPR